MKEQAVKFAQVQAEFGAGQGLRAARVPLLAEFLQPQPGLPDNLGDLPATVLQPRHAVGPGRDQLGEGLRPEPFDLCLGDVVERGHRLERKPQLQVRRGFLQLPLRPLVVAGADAAGAFEREFRVEQADGRLGGGQRVGRRQLGMAVVRPRRVGKQVLDSELRQLVFLVAGNLVTQFEPALHAEPVPDNVPQIPVPERDEVPVGAVDDDLPRIFHVRYQPGAVHPRQPGQGHGARAGEHLDDLARLRRLPGVPRPDDVLQGGPAVQDDLVDQRPHRAGQHQVAPFDLLGDHGLQQGGAAAHEFMQLRRQGSRDPVSKGGLEHLLGFDHGHVREPHLSKLARGDEPVEVGRQVGGALRGGDQPGRAGLQQVQQDPGALFVKGTRVVQQDDALSTRGVIADQRGDAVQDCGR